MKFVAARRCVLVWCPSSEARRPVCCRFASRDSGPRKIRSL